MGSADDAAAEVALLNSVIKTEVPNDAMGGGGGQPGSGDRLSTGKLKVQWDNLMKRITEKEDDQNEDAVEILRAQKTDSQRSKMLREVLMSAARSNLEMHGTLPIMTSPERVHPQQAPRVVVRAPQESRQAAASAKRGQQLDSDPFSPPRTTQDLESGLAAFVAEASGSEGLDRILKRSGRRIAGLHGRLQDSGGPPPRSGGQVSRSASSSGIRLVARPQGASGAEDLLADRCAAKFLDEHLRFEELDRLLGTLDENDGFDHLRASFPRRRQYHDTVVELNDHLLTDPGGFRRTVLTPQPASRRSSEAQRRCQTASVPSLNSRKEPRHLRA